MMSKKTWAVLMAGTLAASMLGGCGNSQQAAETAETHHITKTALVPREYIIGIGCRKGKSSEEMLQFVETQLQKLGISWKQIKAIATIDIKKEEEAIAGLVRAKHLPLFTFDAETLAQVEGSYTASSFVKQTVGADNVCERAAMAGCDGTGKLVLNKQTEHGMTLAIVRCDWRLTLYEE